MIAPDLLPRREFNDPDAALAHAQAIYDAAAVYQQANTPTIIIGGEDYGMGSSRDWAAKGTNLLGVRAVIVESFERIHRSNLVGMGVIPFEFTGGEIRVYDKRHRTPAMRHIDYGLGVFRAAAFAGCPRDAVVDLAAVQTDLCRRGQLAGHEIKERFYEIGSHEGLSELDALLRKGGIPPAANPA